MRRTLKGFLSIKTIFKSQRSFKIISSLDSDMRPLRRLRVLRDEYVLGMRKPGRGTCGLTRFGPRGLEPTFVLFRL